jgi:hypothetical protein
MSDETRCPECDATPRSECCYPEGDADPLRTPQQDAEPGEDLPYPSDTGRTHWDGCWRHPGHHNCAVAEVDRLRARTQREISREATELHHVRMQRDGLRNILRSVYRRLRDGREVLPSQMEALRICYDRRRSLDGLTTTDGEPDDAS